MNAVVVQSDGKIVLAGYAKDGTNSTTSPPEQFALVRLNMTARRRWLRHSWNCHHSSRLLRRCFGEPRQAVAVQTDGKIVAAGFANVDAPIPHPDFGLMHYNGNGSLDTNFWKWWQGYRYFCRRLTFSASATSLLIQPDGKIVVGGVVQSLSTANDFALARYNNDGSLDSTFGNGGKVTTDFGSAAEQINGLAFQLDQNQLKIVAVGQFAGGQTNHQYALARYNANGSLDSTFGTGGKVVTAVDPLGADAAAVSVLTNGTILVTGGGPNISLARYDVHGSLDPTFGNGGTIVTTIPGGAFPNALAIQSDGKILVSGSWAGCFTVVRYRADGTAVDPNFGAPTVGPNAAQVCFPPFGGNAFAMALDSGDKIIVAGDSGLESQQRITFAVARLLNDITSPTPLLPPRLLPLPLLRLLQPRFNLVLRLTR